jgi:DNA polymerase-3 subunit alpha
VGRVMGMLYGDVDRIAKLVPLAPRITLKKALEIEPRLKELYEKDEEVKKLIDIGFKLEGMARNASTHAAGVVISKNPLTEDVPLCRGSNDEIITQFDMNDVEDVGLLKMDFLGLKTLTVIMDTLELIEKTKGKSIALAKIPIDDPATFELLSKANTVGVFQLESPGMRDLSHRLGLTKFDDILALVALFRPGPMHMLEDYIERKHGKVKFKYDHPGMEPILKSTYGIMLYQEQVMMMANQLAGFTLAEADILRHAMAKKKVDQMARMEEAFIKGAVEKGISRPQAEKIFRTMARFAEYGFNKSHSAAYALIAYRTAYLKAHFPREYMAALLTSEVNNMDKLMKYVAECQAMGIKVSPPDVNESYSKFTVVGDAILFGIAAIKNVGEGAVESIVSARQSQGPFATFFDFLDRIDLFAVNKKVIESLIKCGATDSLGGNRAQKMAVLDRGIEMAHRKRRDREKGQTTLFESFEKEEEENGVSIFPDREEYPQNELLAMEKELLGMYITGHPLSKYEKTLKLYASHTTAQLSELKDRSRVRLGGIVTQVVEKTSRQTGKKLAICQFEDLSGAVELMVYSKKYRQFAPLLQKTQPLIIEGTVKSREMGSNVAVSDIYPLEKAQEKFARALHVDLHVVSTNEQTLKNLLDTFRDYRGSCPVFLDFSFATGEKILLQAGRETKVKCSPRLIEKIESLLGENSVYIKT